MLTIKHVEDNGHESVSEAESISYDPGAGISSSGVQEVTIYCSGEKHYIYANGIIYVMNEAGSTVAKYYLDRPSRQQWKAAQPPKTK